MATREYSFYPGCSSQKGASSSNYLVSVQTMCEELDVTPLFFVGGAVTTGAFATLLAATSVGCVKRDQVRSCPDCPEPSGLALVTQDFANAVDDVAQATADAADD